MNLDVKALYCQKVLPAVFDDSLSYYELCCKLLKEIVDLIEKHNYVVDEIIDIFTELNEHDSRIDDLESYLNDLSDQFKNVISSLVQGTLQYDVQRGTYIDTMQAQRDMFNDVTVHGITVGDLGAADLTVAQLSDSGLNTRGLAVMGQYLISKFDIPSYFTEIK